MKKKPSRRNSPPQQLMATQQLMAAQQIKAIRLVRATSELNLKGGKLPPTSSANVGFNIGGNPEEKTILANAICEIVSHYENDSDLALKIQCEYQVVYEFPNRDFPTVAEVQANIQAFQTSVMIQLWPFIRHYVFWVSSQMGIPPIFLPPFQFQLGGPPTLAEGTKKRVLRAPKTAE